MTANSSVGKGNGSSKKLTTTQLSTLANGPSIIFTGTVEGSAPASPPSSSGIAHFPYPLPGGASKYVVLLTSVNGGYSQVADLFEDDDGNFIGFLASSESDGTIMYMVAKIGSKPKV